MLGISTGFLWTGIKGLITGSMDADYLSTPTVHAGRYWFMEVLWLGTGTYLGLKAIVALWRNAKTEYYVTGVANLGRGFVILSLTLLGLVLFLAYVGAAHRP